MDPNNRNFIDLGLGYTLEPLDFDDNRNKYSYLYMSGQKISDMIFRKGGLGGTFIDGYCSLISYPNFKLKEGSDQESEFGTHCIVNLKGDIAMSEEDRFSHDLYHIKGLVAKKKDSYYNLVTSEIIVLASSNSRVETDEFIWVEHKYDFDYYTANGEKKFPMGVYKINCYTGDVEFYKKEMNINTIKI